MTGVNSLYDFSHKTKINFADLLILLYANNNKTYRALVCLN